MGVFKIYTTIMDNKMPVITDFDMQLIADYFKGLNRQGPGSDEQTEKALSFIPELQSMTRIADIGCGTGAQTRVLAANTRAQIVANDLLPELIAGLNRRMAQNGFENRVYPVQGSMTELTFEDESLDLIWAEGSIYNIGFEKGFREWKRFLKPGGYMAVTECCWLSAARPAQMEFFEENFPEITQISAKLHTIEELGYKPVAHFILPENCWTEHYYAPMKEYMELFLKQQQYAPQAEKFVYWTKEEILFYQTHKEYYGYVFFIAQKPE